MRLFVFHALLVLASTMMRADDLTAYVEKLPSLGVKLTELAPAIDRLMERSEQDERFPYQTRWTLYGQADTALYLVCGTDGLVREASMQFYLGWDQNRERHYDQCLPIARFLIHSLLKQYRPSLKDIDAELRKIEHTQLTKDVREKGRALIYRYKMGSVTPEEQDGYRCFRIEIGHENLQQSTDR